MIGHCVRLFSKNTNEKKKKHAQYRAEYNDHKTVSVYGRLSIVQRHESKMKTNFMDEFLQ